MLTHGWSPLQEASKPIRTWEVLKGVIGKDLLDADLPISQYAPFTALHARCAELECTRLLDQVHPGLSYRPGSLLHAVSVPCKESTCRKLAATDSVTGALHGSDALMHETSYGPAQLHLYIVFGRYGVRNPVQQTVLSLALSAQPSHF